MNWIKFGLIGYCLGSFSFGFAQSPVVSLLKAKVLLEQNKTDLAREVLTNVASTANRGYYFYKESGDYHFQKTQYSEAIENYLKADSIFKNGCSLELSKSYAGLGNVQLSLSWLEKHLTGEQKKKELEITKDVVFNSVSGTPEWKKFWKRDWYSESELEISAIHELLRLGRIDQAAEELEENRVKILPRHAYYALQANVFYMQNQPEQAILNLNQAIGLHPMSDEYLYFRAELLNLQKKSNESLADISKAMQLNSMIPAYYLKRAQIAISAGQLNIAEADMKIYQDLYPDSSETLHTMGLMEKARGNHLSAMAYFDKLLEKNYANPQYFLERGSLALDTKQISKADNDFGMALDLNPKYMEAYLQKGNTRFMLQDADGACYCWKKAKQYGSNEAANLIYKNCKE